MAVIINGTSGITNVNGSASTPAETGLTTNTGIYYGTNTVGLATNGTSALFIDASQNVGIGTSSPASRLNIATGASTSCTMRFTANNTGTGAGDRGRLDFYSADNSGTAYQLGYMDYDRADGTGTASYIAWANRVSGTVAERMRIDSSGNLGIGTSSPSYKLQVAGSIKEVQSSEAATVGNVQSTFAASFQRTSTDTVFNIGYATTPDAWVLSASYGTTGAYKPIAFATSDTERMRIDSSGNLLINTTSTIGGSAGVLQVKGQASSTAAVLQIGTDGQNGFSFRNSATTQVGTIVVNTAATAYNTSSDYRLKENIAPMTGALAKVSELKPVTYTWKSTGEAGEGFIAHELQTVVPDCVTGAKDAVDADGNPIYQGIDTSFLVATLTAAIQEQQALITQLQADVATLKGQA